MVFKSTTSPAVPSTHGFTLGFNSITSPSAVFLPGLGSDGGCEDNDFRPFPWATHSELNSQSVSCLIGRRVQIKEYTVNVLHCLDVCRTVSTLKVVVLEPKSYHGAFMALQCCNDKEALEPLARVAKIFMKMDETDPVPHTVSMRAFGALRVPRKPVFGCINLRPQQSDNRKALLMTLPHGCALKKNCFDGEADKITFKKQLAEFAESMHSKGLVHGGLTLANVYWNPDLKEATITSFENAVDKACVGTRNDALTEMVRFLGEKFGDGRIVAQTLAATGCLIKAPRVASAGLMQVSKAPRSLDARTKLHLLASGDDVGFADTQRKLEF